MFQTQRTSTRSSFISSIAGIIVVLGVVFLAVAAVFAVGSRTASALRANQTQVVRADAATSPSAVAAPIALQTGATPRS